MRKLCANFNFILTLFTFGSKVYHSECQAEINLAENAQVIVTPFDGFESGEEVPELVDGRYVDDGSQCKFMMKSFVITVTFVQRFEIKTIELYTRNTNEIESGNGVLVEAVDIHSALCNLNTIVDKGIGLVSMDCPQATSASSVQVNVFLQNIEICEVVVIGDYNIAEEPIWEGNMDVEEAVFSQDETYLEEPPLVSEETIIAEEPTAEAGTSVLEEPSLQEEPEIVDGTIAIDPSIVPSERITTADFGGVVNSFIFTKHQDIAVDLVNGHYAAAYGTSQVHCAVKCIQMGLVGSCYGFIWLGDEDNKCLFVTDQYTNALQGSSFSLFLVNGGSTGILRSNLLIVD